MTNATKPGGPTGLEEDVEPPTQLVNELHEGLDYYLEDGLFVFTATFLRKRGYCCESGCRNCPYQNSNIDSVGE